jgi:kynurenine formamidase
LSPTVPRIASFPPPRIERIASIPQRPLNITELQMIVHTGTHVDSPRHFYNDGPAFQDIPLERLMGQGVVWHIDKPLYGVIESADLECMRPALEPGDMLAIDTGAAERVGTPDYDRHASLSVAAAEWLVKRKVKLVAVDMPTPDIAIDKRPEGFIWPVHRVLLADGVLIAEQVTNLGSLAGRRAEFMFCPLNIADCDGAPARVLARAIAN